MAIHVGMIFSSFVLDGVCVGAESESPPLDPCRCHERHCLYLIENVHDWMMNCRPFKYKMIDDASLSRCVYFLSAGARVRDAKAMSHFASSGIAWLLVRREGEASHPKISGSSGSKCTRRSDDCNKCLPP